jgi:lipopolysaccharide export system protein LptC
MTDAPQIRTGRDRLSAITAPRASAIPQAMRHSARVTRLRRWILWGAGLIVVSVGLGLLVSSLRFLPTDLNLARIALKGTSIVIDGPRLVGYQKDGRPYEIRARQGVQDITHPDVFDLDGLDIRIESAEAGALSMTAAKGHYSARADRAEMSGGVSMSDNKSFDMRLASAVFDLKTSKMTSDTPVKVRLVGGEVDAKSVEFSEKERRARFSGGVHSLIYGEGAEPANALKPSP